MSDPRAKILAVVSEFVDPFEYRTAIAKPVTVGDKTVGTNGHVLCCGPIVDGVEELADKHMATTISEFIGRIEKASYAPVVAAHHPSTISCASCSGKGKRYVQTCPECDGSGEVDAETDFNTYHDLECLSCRGSGSIPGDEETECTKCDGYGEGASGNGSPGMIVNGICVQRKYFDLINDRPGLTISPVSERAGLFFRFGEFSGAIMPYKV